MIPFLMAILVGSFYWWGGAVWDDHELIVGYLWNIQPSSLWIEPVFGGENAASYYRPLAMHIMAALPSIASIHMFITVLHAFNSWLIYALLGENERAKLSATLFAVHPIASEVLGWASCVPDAMALNLGLLAVYWYKRNIWVAGIILLLGILCKEIAFLPLLVAICSTSDKASRRKAAKILVLALGLVGVLRALFQVDTSITVQGKFDVIPKVVGYGTYSLFWPFPQMPVRDILTLPWLYAGIGLVLLGFMVWKSKNRWWLLMVFPMLVSLPPILTGYLAAERYLYMPLAGLCLWIGHSIPERKRNAQLLLLILVFSGIHWFRSIPWHNDISLFTKATKSLPSSGYAWHLKGMAELHRNDFEQCADSFSTAMTTEHKHHKSRFMALVCLVESKQWRRGYSIAESGPMDNLTKEYIEYWIRAANGSNELKRAKQLQELLR